MHADSHARNCCREMSMLTASLSNVLPFSCSVQREREARPTALTAATAGWLARSRGSVSKQSPDIDVENRRVQRHLRETKEVNNARGSNNQSALKLLGQRKKEHRSRPVVMEGHEVKFCRDAVIELFEFEHADSMNPKMVRKRDDRVERARCEEPDEVVEVDSERQGDAAMAKLREKLFWRQAEAQYGALILAR